MKNLFKISLVAIALVAVPLAQAQNLSGIMNIGITNIPGGTTVAAPTSPSNALATAILETKNHQEVALQWRYIYSNTNSVTATNTSYMIVGVSQVASNLVPIAFITNTVALTTNGWLGNAGMTQNCGANINLGSFRYWGIIGVYNGATNSVNLNLVSPTNGGGFIFYQFKDVRNGINK